jgi:RimJ/RimL family protein N-acetyltransferase
MKPYSLRSERLVLDQPTADDRDAITEYCRDPLFETFMTLPWPYEPWHANYFVELHVPQGWESGGELTWALRDESGGPLLGVISWRSERNDIGYWIGAPHRGKGYMTEAVAAVTAHLFSEFALAEVGWECVVGNAASAAVARKTGFRYSGVAPTDLAFRDGTHPLVWHAILTAGDTTEKAGWPQ